MAIFFDLESGRLPDRAVRYDPGLTDFPWAYDAEGTPRYDQVDYDKRKFPSLSYDFIHIAILANSDNTLNRVIKVLHRQIARGVSTLTR